MGVIFEKEFNQDVIAELEQCSLLPPSPTTNEVQQMYTRYTRTQIRSTGNARFGLTTTAAKLRRFTQCSDIQHAAKVVARWNASPAKNTDFRAQLLKQTPSTSTDRVVVSVAPIFCAMALLAQGTVAEKLKLLLHFVEQSPHESLSRTELNRISKHVIHALSVLLDLTSKQVRQVRVFAKLHIFGEEHIESVVFPKVSRAVLSIWVATSKYLLHVLCVHCTQDKSERYAILDAFYGDSDNTKPRNLAAINTLLKTSSIKDLRRQQNIEYTFQWLSTSQNLHAVRSYLLGSRLYTKKSEKRKRTNVERLSFRPTCRLRDDSRLQNPQYYELSDVVPDTQPVSLNEILSDFEKHFKLAFNTQQRIRSPALVTVANAKSTMDLFTVLANGDMSNLEHLAKASDNIPMRIEYKLTIKRVFEKYLGLYNTESFTQFVRARFPKANEEEIERVLAFNKKTPEIYAWTLYTMQRLFAALLTYNQSKSDISDSSNKVQMKQFYALAVHCKELREYVIRITRQRRSMAKQMVSFRECCEHLFKQRAYEYEYQPFSPETNLVDDWIRSLSNQSEFAMFARTQYEKLFNALQRKEDATIDDESFEAVATWIFPDIAKQKQSLSKFLFPQCCREGVGKEDTARIHMDEFVMGMQYVWVSFRREFKLKQLSAMQETEKRQQRRSSVRPSFRGSRFRMQRASSMVLIRRGSDLLLGKRVSKGRASRNSTFRASFGGILTMRGVVQKTEIKSPKDLVKYSEEIKDTINNFMYVADAFWSPLLRNSKGDAKKAWMVLVDLVIQNKDATRTRSNESVSAVFRRI